MVGLTSDPNPISTPDPKPVETPDPKPVSEQVLKQSNKKKITELNLGGRKIAKAKLPEKKLPPIPVHKHRENKNVVYRKREAAAQEMILNKSQKPDIITSDVTFSSNKSVNNIYTEYETILPNKYFRTMDMKELHDTFQFLDDYGLYVSPGLTNFLNVTTIRTINELFCKNMLSLEEINRYIDVINVKSILLSGYRSNFNLAAYEKICDEIIEKFHEEHETILQKTLMVKMAETNKQPEAPIKTYVELYDEKLTIVPHDK